VGTVFPDCSDFIPAGFDFFVELEREKLALCLENGDENQRGAGERELGVVDVALLARPDRLS
jgi:hypothetical protein